MNSVIEICSKAHQPASRDELPKLIDGRYTVPKRQTAELFAAAVEESVRTDDEGLCFLANHGRECVVDFAYGAGMKHLEF